MKGELTQHQLLWLEERVNKGESLEEMLPQQFAAHDFYLITNWNEKTNEIRLYDVYLTRAKAIDNLPKNTPLGSKDYFMVVECEFCELSARTTNYGFSTERLTPEDIEFIYHSLENLIILGEY